MTLRLAASSDVQALAIRDHVLPFLRERGSLQIQRDSVRLIELRMDMWSFRHWTPFNDLNPGEASSPGYRHAIERQRTQSELPYGLDVWHGPKVFRMLWNDDGHYEVVSFIRGSWEPAALAL